MHQLPDGTETMVAYANFYVADGGVVVPTSGHSDEDSAALATIGEAFADWACQATSSRTAVEGCTASPSRSRAFGVVTGVVACDTEPVHPLVEVATGFSAVVYRTSDGCCLKVAREAEVAVRHRRETALLGVVAGTVGVEVQWPARDVPASREWPHGAVLCPWLPGRHLSAADEPASVAAFLRRLADVPVPAVAGLVEPDVFGWLQRFVAGFERYVPRIAEPSFVHGDLWSENMLARDGVLTGVVDWEFAAVGDPAADLAGLWYLGCVCL